MYTLGPRVGTIYIPGPQGIFYDFIMSYVSEWAMKAFLALLGTVALPGWEHSKGPL